VWPNTFTWTWDKSSQVKSGVHVHPVHLWLRLVVILIGSCAKNSPERQARRRAASGCNAFAVATFSNRLYDDDCVTNLLMPASAVTSLSFFCNLPATASHTKNETRRSMTLCCSTPQVKNRLPANLKLARSTANFVRHSNSNVFLFRVA